MKVFFRRIAIFLASALFVLSIGTMTSCSGQTEQQALESIRQLTRSGGTPPEDYVATIERRFANTRTGALAKLLHASIRFDKKDYDGAATLLDTPNIARLTNVGDHALWLRGQSLFLAGKNNEAMAAFEKLGVDFPDSIRLRDARLMWADAAAASGQFLIVPAILSELNAAGDAEALIRTARSFEAKGDQAEAMQYYRRAYFYGAGTNAATEAQGKLTAAGQPLTPESAEEALIRGDKLAAAKDLAGADRAYADLAARFPMSVTPALNLKRLKFASSLRKAADAQSAFNRIPFSAPEKEEAYYQLTLAYARSRMWPQVNRTLDEMRQKYPKSEWLPKAWVEAGTTAEDQKNMTEARSLLRSAVLNFPSAVEVAGAQFDLAWDAHQSGDTARSAQMLTEHLARYVDRDTANRGKAGYWAARDSERAGLIAEACALYDGVFYRYAANWYGYLAEQRLSALRSQGKCTGQKLPADSLVPKAVANLRIVTVAPETAGERELRRGRKSEDLSDIGLFDWAIAELQQAQKTAPTSPKINLALAQFYRQKGDNVSALLALAKSYPDYSQMFPEEMGREEWDIFYPLTNWEQITAWAKHRSLDKYQVAGLIRQESVFNPSAKSGANAYGLMQLLLPTARLMAKKYGSAYPQSAADLYQPAMNIELGTAYMRDQFDKFGRIEYVAIAYNAGPGRVNPWRAQLPIEMDEFVEAIPFRETKAYVQGVVRNSAQYRRLYDDNGKFKSNVGSRPIRSAIETGSPQQLAADLPEVRLAEE